MSRTTASALLACLLAAFPATAGDPPLFLADSQFDDLATRIFVVDPSTGDLTLRADLGAVHTPILGMAAADGTVVYAAGTDTTPENRCEGLRACLLLRVSLDPGLPEGSAVEEIGVIRTESGVVAEIVGMTFRSDGVLWAASQETNGLYTIDLDSARASLVGILDLNIDGGDLTFDGDGRLLLWNSLGDQAGLYEVDPETAVATVFELHAGLSFSGLAALGHTNRLYGVSPPSDRVHEIDSTLGLTGVMVPLLLGGSRFDHKRGDLDSPFCSADAACDDEDRCTLDRCTPGGCRAEPIPLDDGDACTIDSCDPATGPVHRDLRESDADGDGMNDCDDACPGTAPGRPVDPRGCSIEDRCPCEGPGRPWKNHGEYVSCVARAAREIGGEPGARGPSRRSAVTSAAREACGRTSDAERATRAAPAL